MHRTAMTGGGGVGRRGGRRRAGRLPGSSVAGGRQTAAAEAASVPRGGGGGVASSERRDKGVDPELLRSLPVTVYRAGATAKGPAGEDNDTDAGVPDKAPVLTRVVVGSDTMLG